LEIGALVAVQREVAKASKRSTFVRRPIANEKLDFGGDFALVREELDAGEVWGGRGVEGGRGGGGGGGEEGETEFLRVVAEAWGLPAFGPGAVNVELIGRVLGVLA